MSVRIIIIIMGLSYKDVYACVCMYVLCVCVCGQQKQVRTREKEIETKAKIKKSFYLEYVLISNIE